MKNALAAAAVNSMPGYSREHYLEAFSEAANDGFLIIDNSLCVIHFSSAFDNYHHLHTGKRLKEGKYLNEVFPRLAMQEIRPYLSQALNGDDVKFIISYPPVDGTTYQYELNYQALRDKSGEVIGVTMRVQQLNEKEKTSGKLRKSEDLFKALINNSTDAFQLTDADFELQYVSATVKNILGYTSDDLVGTNGLDHVHPDDRDQVHKWFKKIRSEKGKSRAAEYRIRHKSGQYVWIENYSRNMLDNPNVNAIVMNCRSIQAKKTADYALVQAEQRLSLLLNNTEESFIILNSRLRIIAYNKAAQQHSPFFFKQELQSDRSIFDLVELEEIEDLINLFERVFEGQEMSRETAYTDEENQPHIFSHIYRPIFDDNRDIFGVFITSTDITKHKLAEQQVKDSEVRFKTIIQESFDAVLIANSSGRITYSSPSIVNVLGYSPEELMGRKGFHFVHPDDLRSAIGKYSEVLIHPNNEKNIDVRMLNKRNEYVWIEVKGKNMFNNQYVEGILISLRDITARKQAEEIISLSELRFKGLVQSGSDMISMVDENSILQYSSPTLKSIMGIDPASKYGQNIFDYVHPADVVSVKEQFHRFCKSNIKQTYIGPYRYSNDAGQYYWVESTITNFLSDPSIKGIVFNSRDITERKKLTEDLAANTERLKSAQKIAKLGYFEYDLVTSSSFCSDQFCEILGLKKEACKNLSINTVENVIHPADRERFKKEVEQSSKGIKDFNDEYRIILGDGTEKVVHAMGGLDKSNSGISQKFSVTLQDITDSKMAMFALQTMEGRFRSLFENSIDGVIISLPSGEVISANPALCKMIGYTQNEIVQLRAADLLDLDSPSILTMREERKKSGCFIGEILIRHKDGHYIPAEITSINMTDAQGEVYHSTIVRDITEKKKIELEQQSLTRELVKNNQDLQQFSFITSHNLRAPVANLMSLLSLYNKENVADDFNQVLIEKFEEATLQLNSTLNDLIDVLVIKSNTNIEKQELRFSDIYQEVRKNIDNLLNEQGGELKADFTAVDTIEYNKIHLESIFLNLISNAIRYRSPGRKPVINIRSYIKDNWVIVDFEDNGLGIDMKRYGDRLFGLYQRFHNSKEGKGLGLYMIKSQVLAMGGQIEVESEPGKGSTFRIYFKPSTR